MPDPTPPTLPATQAPQPDVSFTTVQALPPPDDAGTFSQDGGDYLGAGMTVEISVDQGLRALAVAGTLGQAAAAFVRQHSGCGFKIISYVATRIGNHPAVPTVDTGSANDVPLSQHYALFTPQPALNGVPVWGVYTIYLYGLQVPPGPGDQLDFGATPLMTTPASSNVLVPSDFNPYLTSSSSNLFRGLAGNLQVPPKVTW